MRLVTTASMDFESAFLSDRSSSIVAARLANSPPSQMPQMIRARLSETNFDFVRVACFTFVRWASQPISKIEVNQSSEQGRLSHPITKTRAINKPKKVNRVNFMAVCGLATRLQRPDSGDAWIATKTALAGFAAAYG